MGSDTTESESNFTGVIIKVVRAIRLQKYWNKVHASVVRQSTRLIIKINTSISARESLCI